MSLLADPTDKDEHVPTDTFYGLGFTPSTDDLWCGDSILPDVPVGRIPFTDPAMVARILGQGASLVPHWTKGIAVSASVWTGASTAVLQSIAGAGAPTLWSAPPTGEAHVAEAMAGTPGRLYFNVHGTDQEPVWVGEGGGDYPAVLRPKDIRVASSAIVVSEACYGANLVQDEPSIGSAFLIQGAGCFVGSTIIAWGPSSAPPRLADLIVVGMYRGLDSGLTAGQALIEAKRAILSGALADDEPLSPQVHNTLLSFVLYGSPNARVAGAKASPLSLPHARPHASRAHSLPPSTGGSILAQTRARMGGGGSSTLAGVRNRMAAGMQAADWAELSRGRIAFAQLATELQRGTELQRRIQTLLGATPLSVELLRYTAKGRNRVSATASEKTPWGRKHVALVTLEDGTVQAEYVSR